MDNILNGQVEELINNITQPEITFSSEENEMVIRLRVLFPNINDSVFKEALIVCNDGNGNMNDESVANYLFNFI